MTKGVAMKIAIADGHGGYKLKEEIKPYIESLGHTVTDFGTYSEDSVDYPDYAAPCARAVVSGEADRGIVICGTGIGISIAANKIKGVRCALCTDPVARLTREHNDANMLAMGARIIGGELARGIVKAFLETDFSNGKRHIDRINKITELERAK